MASAYTWVELTNWRGGRNNTDDPTDLSEGQVVEARNGDFHRTSGFRKRGGATAPTIGSAFSGVIRQLLRHIPGNNPTLAELWAVDDAAPEVVGRMASASTFTAVTLEDAIDSKPSEVHGASFENKLYLAYDSDEDRLHVWDPTLGTPKVRRAGLATPTAPTVANTGSGSYAATIRYYRTRTRIKNGSIVVAQSEPSVSVSFTPSGSGTDARVTHVTTTDDGDVTHWILEASDDDVTFYEVDGAETAIASLTYDDDSSVATYSDGTISAVIGSFVPMKSVKYLAVAFNRLFGIGAWESGQPQSRLYFTAAKGASDPPRGDDERVPRTTNLKNERDLDEGTGGGATGFAGPINGVLFVFKETQIWRIIATGQEGNPLDIVDVSKVRGAANQDAIAEGIDNDGRPVIYFVDPQVGPCVLGSGGPKPIGHGVRDLWDTVNLAATNRVALAEYYAAKGNNGQVWFWWATGSSNDPDLCCIFDIESGGWTAWDTGGEVRQAAASVMFSKTLGTSMSRELVPYVSHSTENNTLLRCDTTNTSDDGTTFKAEITLSPQNINQGNLFVVSRPHLLAKAATGVTITLTASVDYGRVVKATDSVSLTPDGSETHVFREFVNMEIGDDMRAVTFTIGDAAAVANSWTLNGLYMKARKEEAGV